MGAGQLVDGLDRSTSERDPQDALGRIAIALNSTLGLSEVLDVLAGELLAHTGARRASVLLCAGDETGPAPPSPAGGTSCPSQLEPAVALARQPDVALWHAFRDAGPIELDEVQQAAFARARALVVEDAAASELIPVGWAGRFGLECVVLVPLFAEGEPCGLLAVDYAREAGVPDAERRLLEAMAEQAGIAVAKARRYEQTPNQAWITELLPTARRLQHDSDERSIAQCLSRALGPLLDAEAVAIVRVSDDGWLHPLTVTAGHALPAPVQLDQAPRHLVDQVTACRGRRPSEACELPAEPWLRAWFPGVETRGFLLLGLPGQGCPRAVVLAARSRTAPVCSEAVMGAEMLVTVAADALLRHEVHVVREPTAEHDDAPGPAADAEPTLASLITPREHEVLKLLADDYTNDQIAERLYVTTNTIKTHVSHVLHKLDVEDRREAARWARVAGLVTRPGSRPD